MADLTVLERDMLNRLSAAAHRHAAGEAGDCVYVAVQYRKDALQALAAKGLARCWSGDGPDRGLLIGRITPAGREADRTRP